MKDTFIEDLMSVTKDIKKAYILRADINYYKMPITKFELNSDNIKIVNDIINFCRGYNINKIKRTPSGGVCINRSTFSNFAFDLRYCGAGFELTLIAGFCCRIQLGHCDIDDESNKDKVVSGTKALKRFEQELKKDGIDLKSYSINNGKEVNEEICKPKIKSYVANRDINKAQWFENVHHLDFHKAYMSGLYASHPEMRDTIQRLYDLRNTDITIKSVFTNTIGKMHSQTSGLNWRYANLAKDAINTFNEDMLEPLALKLLTSGRRILAYNTDGIWYQGDIYTDENCGPNLTQYENDYTNCKIRFKSDGAYEFYYNGKLYTKLRGRTVLDRTKPRDADGLGWSEGDLFKVAVIQYKISKDNIIEVQGE